MVLLLLISVSGSDWAKLESPIADGLSSFRLEIETIRAVVDFSSSNRASIKKASHNIKKFSSFDYTFGKIRGVIKSVSDVLIFGRGVNRSAIEIPQRIVVAGFIWKPLISLNVNIGHLFCINSDRESSWNPISDVDHIGSRFLSDVFKRNFESLISPSPRFSVKTSANWND